MADPVSFLLFAYNHEDFIEAALRGALDQTYEPLEIVVIEDCSTDRTAEVIERVLDDYRGPKKIIYRKHERNLGLIGSLNDAVSASTGDLLVLAGGDDVSFPERTAAMVGGFHDANVQMVTSNAEVIDEVGHVERLYFKKPPEKGSLKGYSNPEMSVLGAVTACRRTIFDVFGPMDPTLEIEDRGLYLRALLLGTDVYIDRPLVAYRRHSSNVWFGAYERAVFDMEEWRAYEKKRYGWLIGVYGAQLADIETALRLPDADRNGMIEARKHIRTFLMRAKASHRLLDEPGLLTKMAISARVIAGGGSLRFARGWIRKFFFTKSYLRITQNNVSKRLRAIQNG